jgi:hypothetical protein
MKGARFRRTSGYTRRSNKDTEATEAALLWIFIIVAAGYVIWKLVTSEIVLWTESSSNTYERLSETEAERDRFREALVVVKEHGGAEMVMVALEALNTDSRCEHGKGLSDYYQPCGRIHGSQ